jgi:hypothetical protein
MFAQPSASERQNTSIGNRNPRCSDNLDINNLIFRCDRSNRRWRSTPTLCVRLPGEKSLVFKAVDVNSKSIDAIFNEAKKRDRIKSVDIYQLGLNQVK